MRVLITGHRGYIGSHLMKHIVGHELLGIDLETDVTNIANLDRVFESFKPDVVIHTAGLKSVQESFITPGLYEYVNVDGTKNITDMMKKYDSKLIIFSSSATVYENGTQEESPLKSINPYGETKIQAENVIKDSGVKYCILRYFNPVGSNEDINSLNLYPTCIRSCFKNEVLNIYGNCIRDYFYVVDLARFHNVLLGHEFDSNLVMNFGTGIGMSTQDFIELFESTNDVILHKNFHPKRQGDKEISVANVERLKTMFPEFDFTDKNQWLKIVVNL